MNAYSFPHRGGFGLLSVALWWLVSLTFTKNDTLLIALCSDIFLLQMILWASGAQVSQNELRDWKESAKDRPSGNGLALTPTGGV
jgi:hypothetical protein